MSIEKIKNKVRSVHDFPQKGIVFRDLTTAFKDPECLHELSILLTDLYKGKKPEEVLTTGKGNLL